MATGDACCDVIDGPKFLAPTLPLPRVALSGVVVHAVENRHRAEAGSRVIVPGGVSTRPVLLATGKGCDDGTDKTGGHCGLGLVVGLGISPYWSETEASTMQAAAGRFRAAAKEYSRFGSRLFTRVLLRAAPTTMRDWASLQSCGRRDWPSPSRSSGLLAVESESSYDVLCKFEIGEAFFGRQRFADTEWSFSCADEWISRIEADARRFGLAVDPAGRARWKLSSIKPDVEFYSALGRIAGRVG